MRTLDPKKIAALAKLKVEAQAAVDELFAQHALPFNLTVKEVDGFEIVDYYYIYFREIDPVIVACQPEESFNWSVKAAVLTRLPPDASKTS